MKVLVIQQKMIGDVLTSSILFKAIKLEHPSAELHYLVNSHTVPVVENNPFIDKLVLFTPKIFFLVLSTVKTIRRLLTRIQTYFSFNQNSANTSTPRGGICRIDSLITNI